MDVGTLGVRPQWTQRMLTPSGGRDHLGLATVVRGDILGWLSPNVVAATRHPRYWSFYTWIHWEFWQTNRPRRKRERDRFLKPREAILSIGAAGDLCENAEHASLDSGVVGSDTTAPHAASNEVYDASIDYLRSNPAGGYGLIYAGSLANSGLIVPSAPEAGLTCDAPSPDLGKQVAEAFRSHVVDTAYVRDYFQDDRAQVPREVVREYINRACLCQIQNPSSPDLPLLRRVFLNGDRNADAARQAATFRMLVDLAVQTDGTAVDEEAFRQLVYFRQALSGVRYTPLPFNEAAAQGWRIFQAREYYNYALNRVWQWVVAHGLERTNHGLTTVAVSDLLNDANGRLSATSVATHLDVEDPGLHSGSATAQWQAWTADLAAVAGSSLDRAWSIASPLNEFRLLEFMRRLDADDPRALPAAFGLLMLLAARFGASEAPREQPSVARLLMAGDAARLSMSLGFRRLAQDIDGATTAGETMSWLLEDYVIQQHLRAARSKLPRIDTFRFFRDGNRLQFQNLPPDIAMGNSRFDALTTVLHELGLTGQFRTAAHGPTTVGQKFLEDGGWVDASVLTQ